MAGERQISDKVGQAGEAGSQGKPNAEVVHWEAEIDSAKRREKHWRTEAKRICDIYDSEDKKAWQFNILYSNTETLQPALYSQLPSPVVKRRFRDADPLALAGCQVSQRVLAFLLDSNDEDFTNFDDLMNFTVQQALVPGRGLVRFKYSADFTQIIRQSEPTTDQNAADKQADGAATDTPDGQEPGEETFEKVSYETIIGEIIPYDRFYHGYALVWEDVPWCAIEHFMDRQELIDNFGDLGREIPLTVSPTESSDDKENRTEPRNADGAKLGHVFEVWDKSKREVIFLAPAYKTGLLKKVDDPLKLHGFYPWPRPVQFFKRSRSMLPQPLYVFYEEQAKELNTITRRINKILHAMKVRGFYDGTLQGLDKLFENDDATLIPAENVSSMQQGQNLQNAIWFMPLDMLMNVLQQLYAARQQIKQTIYEVTGISDLLRGMSSTAETATAQNLKNQWGTLRLQRMQKEVQRFVRDCLRIMAEIAFSKFSVETFQKMTSLPFPTAQQQQQAQQTLAELQQQVAMAQQQAVQQQPLLHGGQPSQPVQPQIPSQVQQQAAKLQQILQQPSWDAILDLMRSDLYRRFRVDIETNSTISAEATEDKQAVGEFMNAMAQFMNGIEPMVSSGTMPFAAAKEIMLAITRRYRFGVDVEEELEQMQPPPQQQPGQDPKVQAEAEKAKADLQAHQQKSQHNMAMMQEELKLKQAEGQAKLQQMQQQAALKQKENEMKLMQMQMQMEFAQRKHAVDLAKLLAPPPVAVVEGKPRSHGHHAGKGGK